jgi:hypothetical protein
VVSAGQRVDRTYILFALRKLFLHFPANCYGYIMTTDLDDNNSRRERAAVPEPARGARGRKSRIGIYTSLDDALEQLEHVGGLPSPIEAEGIWGDIWYAEAHNSTAIEGNTLVLKEVEALLRDGRAVGNKQLRDYLEVQGYGDAAQWVYGQALNPVWSKAEGPL